MTWPDLAALITAVTLACGTFGRGIVWLVQRQSRKTIAAKNDELSAYRRAFTRKVRRRRLRSLPRHSR